MRQKEVLRAVVIADTFDKRFAPLIDETPKVLLPLLGTPILNYTLEYLASNKVREVYICTCRHFKELKSFIDASTWGSNTSPFKVKFVYSDELRSLGDIIREIEARDLFRSDFVLLTGDVICNIPLNAILEEHMERKKKDKMALMTLVYNQVLSNHTLKCKNEETLLIRNKTTSKLVFYMKGVSKLKKFKTPNELLTNVNLVLENELIDTNIAICSAEVLPQFMDNFDLQTREDFIKCILDGEELMGNTIFVHKTMDYSATPVSNLLMYDKISQEMINNYSNPYMLNSQLRLGNEKFICYQSSTHIQDGVQLHPTSTLCSVAIGSNSVIGENSVLQNSVVGKHCKIGRNVHIVGCYLWDNVVVGDGCQLEKCLLATNCELKDNVNIHPGSILGQDVTVGPNITLPNFTKVKASSNDEVDAAKTKPTSHLGTKGVGYILDHKIQEEDDDASKFNLDIWGEVRVKQILEAESSDEFDDEDELDMSDHEDETMGSYSEILDSLLRGVEEGIKALDIVHDINSLKFAHNISMEDLIGYLTKALLSIPGVRQPELKPTEYFTALKKVMVQYTPLFKKYVKRNDDEKCLLLYIEYFFSETNQLLPILPKTLHHLYDLEIVSEEAIITWHEKPSKDANLKPEQQEMIRECTQTFAEWLKNAEEESDE